MLIHYSPNNYIKTTAKSLLPILPIIYSVELFVISVFNFMYNNKVLTTLIIISLNLGFINKQKVLSYDFINLPENQSSQDDLFLDNLAENLLLKNEQYNNNYLDFYLLKNSTIKLLNKSSNFPFLIASPENFNPSLTIPQIILDEPEIITPILPNNAVEESKKFPLKLESINTRFFVDTDNYGQRNQFIESTINFNTSRDDQIELKTGVNTFAKPDIDKVYNIPLIFGWKTKINDVTLKINGGVEIFDRFPVAPSFSVVAEAPLLVRIKPEGDLQSLFVLINALEYQPYKFNAETLDNQIKSFRFRPSFYWLIAPDISLFSFSQFSSLNDGNKDYQSFTRLEKKFGEFSVSTNLFTWSFHQNFEQKSGYFSPPDFLVYNLELAWQKNITDFLNCRLVASVGQQRLEGEFSNAQTYESFCDGKISDNISLGLGYKVSNIRTLDTGESSYLNEQFTGKLNIKF